MLALKDLYPGAQHFYVYEMACHCDDPNCHFGREEGDVDPALIFLLEAIREDVGGPVRLNSVCRCENHNTAVGGKKNSTHRLGKAGDIQVEGGRHRFMVLRAAVDHGAEGIGVDKSFVHVDTHKGSPEVPRPSAWSY